jgi:hypothetical protein
MHLWFVGLGLSADSSATINVPKNHPRGIDCFSGVLCSLLEIVELHVIPCLCFFMVGQSRHVMVSFLLSWIKAKLSNF